jgi:NAD(P)H dehydrogenase (quinone)
MKYVITGCDGKLAGRVSEEVLAKVDPSQLIFTCRSLARLNPEKKAHWESKGIAVREANYDDKAGMVQAFKGGNRIYIVSSVTIGEIRRQQHRNVVDAAIEAGVEHLTYTSFLGASDPKYADVYVTPDHTATETYIKECAQRCNIRYNFMRNNLYLENYLTDWSILASLSGNEWHTLAQDAKATFVPKDDSARLAAALLLGKGEDNKAYIACGKEAISCHEIYRIVNEISGKNFKYCPEDEKGLYSYFDSLHIPRDSATGDFSKSPFPWCSNDMVTNEQCIANGMYDVVSDDIAKITGQEPATARELAGKYTYIWKDNVKNLKDIK